MDIPILLKYVLGWSLRATRMYCSPKSYGYSHIVIICFRLVIKGYRNVLVTKVLWIFPYCYNMFQAGHKGLQECVSYQSPMDIPILL